MNLTTQFFKFDNLSMFVGIFVGIFFLLIIIYSFGFMSQKKRLIYYYSYLILTFISSLGAVFSNNLILFMVFWGFLGLLLYLLIGFAQLGLALVWRLTGSLQMDEISISLNTRVAVLAYMCLAAGAFAKAGAMPFHTWVPDTAKDAPTPVVAFLPASLDKLLGIYFLARISLDMFEMSAAVNTFLMMVGSFTIVAAVMMALIQHDLKRLLGYHAVSQVGYMVLGIGTGNPIGIAGGLFHMLNNTLYKSCLFLSGGAVEKEFAKIMPITFTSFLIASLAISGIPPFNGFASKWMIYQGIIKTAGDGSHLWIIWLIAAMFGSALTLASFMKLIHTVFLGQPANKQPRSNEVLTKVESTINKRRETSLTMWIPQVFLAVLCVIFGVFAYRIPLKMFIFPSLGGKIEFFGIWNASLATILIIVGVAVGIIVYLLGTIRKTRETEAFIGGEILEKQSNMRVSGTEFYNTIKDINPLGAIYGLAERKVFDIYDIGKIITFGILYFIKVTR